MAAGVCRFPGMAGGKGFGSAGGAGGGVVGAGRTGGVDAWGLGSGIWLGGLGRRDFFPGAVGDVVAVGAVVGTITDAEGSVGALLAAIKGALLSP